MTAKIAENYPNTSNVDQLSSSHRAAETANVINCHLTNGGHEIVNLTNFVSDVCWAIDFQSSLFIINLPHLYGGMKLHHNLFSFPVNLHSSLTKHQSCMLPSTREVTIDHVRSFGRAVTTANWSIIAYNVFSKKFHQQGQKLQFK